MIINIHEGKTILRTRSHERVLGALVGYTPMDDHPPL